jgi:hypothetical protein
MMFRSDHSMYSYFLLLYQTILSLQGKVLPQQFVGRGPNLGIPRQKVKVGLFNQYANL